VRTTPHTVLTPSSHSFHVRSSRVLKVGPSDIRGPGHPRRHVPLRDARRVTRYEMHSPTSTGEHQVLLLNARLGHRSYSSGSVLSAGGHSSRRSPAIGRPCSER
jgi:hypothetical protein